MMHEALNAFRDLAKAPPIPFEGSFPKSSTEVNAHSCTATIRHDKETPDGASSSLCVCLHEEGSPAKSSEALVSTTVEIYRYEKRVEVVSTVVLPNGITMGLRYTQGADSAERVTILITPPGGPSTIEEEVFPYLNPAFPDVHANEETVRQLGCHARRAVDRGLHAVARGLQKRTEIVLFPN